MGRPAYSLLVLFWGTFYDLPKQKIVLNYMCPAWTCYLGFPSGAQWGVQAKYLNSTQHLNFEVKSGFSFWTLPVPATTKN